MQTRIFNASVNEADAVVLAANLDITSPGSGAATAAQAVKSALEADEDGWEPRSGISVAEKRRTCWYDLEDLNRQRDGDALAAAVTAVMRQCEAVLAAKSFPLVIGGDRSSAIGAMLAAISSFGAGLTIVDVSAHHGLRAVPLPDPQRFGVFGRRSVLSSVVVTGQHVVQVGVRSFSREEAYLAGTKPNFKTFYWGVSRGFVAPNVTELVRAVPPGPVYLSLSVDALDPAVLPGVIEPECGGLGWWYLTDLLETLCAKRSVVGADVTELAPRPEDRLSVRNVAKLVYRLLAWTSRRR